MWSSWYSWFEEVSASAIDTEIGPAQRSGYAVLQIDDGWERGIGDWEANDDFPEGMGAIAERIRAAGMTPGLWIAPFIASAQSRIALDHPEYFVSDEAGAPAIAGYNWGGALLRTRLHPPRGPRLGARHGVPRRLVGVRLPQARLPQRRRHPRFTASAPRTGGGLQDRPARPAGVGPRVLHHGIGSGHRPLHRDRRRDAGRPRHRSLLGQHGAQEGPERPGRAQRPAQLTRPLLALLPHRHRSGRGDLPDPRLPAQRGGLPDHPRYRPGDRRRRLLRPGRLAHRPRKGTGRRALRLGAPGGRGSNASRATASPSIRASSISSRGSLRASG